MTCNLTHQSKQVSWLILFLFSTSVFAANGHIYLGGTIGASRANVGDSNPKINYYDGLLTDAYPTHGNNASTAIIGINGGYEFVGAGLMPAIAFGLAIYDTPSNYSYKGQVIETAEGDPSTTLYNYKFVVTSMRVMLEAQFNWMLGNLVPFINIGVGPTWNRMSGYTETPFDSSNCVAFSPFQSHTNTNFAYQVGLGIGYAFNFVNSKSSYQQERISLGYRYVSLGETSFGSRGVDYPYNLNTGRLTSNELYLTYTHLF